MSDGVYSSFTLSDDAAIEAIITGIPLFCIGILSIGVFTFLLSLKRVDLLSVYLFISSFLAFIAAIVDLGQILIRGHSNAVSGTGLGGVIGFIRAREVLLALSLGTVFLFFWTFVGRRPIGIASKKDRLSAITPSNPIHCGSWQRWGFVGLGLKWSTLLVCILIPILQIVWRVAGKHHRYGNLYVVSSTLETTVSAIFILKIFLNFYLTPPWAQRQVMLNHIAPIVALLISAGLGVGNLVLFAFTETTLGRFLHAIEVYILIVYFLVVTFRFPRQEERTHKPTSSIDKPPLQFSEKTDGGPQPGDPNTTTSRESGLAFLRPWKPGRRESAMSKVSSWIPIHPFSRVYATDEPKTSWFQDKEAAMGPAEPSLLFTMAKTPSPEPPGTAVTPAALSSNANDGGLRPPQSEGRPLTDVSLSYYANAGEFSMAIQDTSTIGSDSPIYGLDGITQGRRKPDATPESNGAQSLTAGPTPREALSPIEELLQQQSELDRSINVLRGLHNRQNSRPNNQVPATQDEEPGTQYITIPKDSRRDTITPSSGLGKPMSSASNRSDFSLSVFPEPPAAPSPELNPRGMLRQDPGRKDPRVGMLPLQIPGFDILSPLGTPSQFGITGRYDSAGTAYDVTSFIGDLTGPTSGYTSGNNIASSSLYKSAGMTFDADFIRDSEQSANVPESDSSSSSPTSATRSPTSTATTPTDRGLGKATMSSSFKAPGVRVQVPEQPPMAALVTQEQPSSLALRPFLSRTASGSARILPPSGPRQSRADSLSRSQSGMASVRF